MGIKKRLDLSSAHRKRQISELANEPLIKRLTYAQEMAEQLVFNQTNALKKENSLLVRINKILFLSGFLASLNTTGRAFAKLAQVHHHVIESLDSLKKVSAVTGTALSIINCIRIPMIYLAAYIVGEKVPFTLTRKAEWLYSGVLLALTITALAAPITAPVIAIVAAGIGCVVSVMTMGKAIYQRSKYRSELEKITAIIAIKTSELRALHEKTLALEKKLIQAIRQENNEEKEQILPDMDNLKALFEAKFKETKDELQDLYNQKFSCEKKLEKKSIGAVLGKGLGLVISAFAVIGLSLSLAFPFIGLPMFAASSLTGLILMGGQVLFSKISQWVSPASKQKSTIGNNQEIKDSLEQDNLFKKSSSQSDILSSMLSTLYKVESSGDLESKVISVKKPHGSLDPRLGSQGIFSSKDLPSTNDDNENSDGFNSPH